jgi:hypothetical protein
MDTPVQISTAPASAMPMPTLLAIALIPSLAFLLAPALVTLVPILVGVIIRSLRLRWAHAVVLIAIAALSLALGVAAFAQHSSEVRAARALAGAAIAGVLGSLVPLAVYFELGYRTRSKIVTVVCWLVSVIPFYYYAIILVLTVADLTNCRPGQYECPV